ncbi:putative agmatinase [Thermococcus sibiricus MM 739]|uniref:Putative agmatinase n=1 Tax=Thermococcus sibiricus (strain DSM 12597 / MM 739) TaxID=604354 RepID=C6A469_THESM|nr:putative agmatinase [Thermococcus sibiricus MM 739]
MGGDHLEEGLFLTEHSIQIGKRGSTYSKDEIDKARELGFEIVTAEEMFKLGIDKVAQMIQERVGYVKVFVTFDIDFIDSAYAPGTGTPEVGGPTSREALELIRKGLKGLNFAGFDLVEVYPQYDPGFITALLAVNIVFEFISLIASNKKNTLTLQSSRPLKVLALWEKIYKQIFKMPIGLRSS